MTAYLDSGTISSTTKITNSDLKVNLDSSTISSSSTIVSDDRGPFADFDTPSSITTPDVILELPTSVVINISLSGSAYEGVTLTASINATTTGGDTSGTGGGIVISDPDEPGYTVDYSPTGQWYTADDDDGVIA